MGLMDLGILLILLRSHKLASNYNFDGVAAIKCLCYLEVPMLPLNATTVNFLI